MGPLQLEPSLVRSLALEGRGTSTPAAGGTDSGASFAEHVRAALDQTNRDLVAAEEAARAVATGKGDIVEAMVALSSAEMSLRQVTTLRNRMLESYQQIMRLQL